MIASAGVNLFVYGSLMFPEILEQLLQRRPALIEAELPGYRRGRLHGKCYPGITACQDQSVNGMLLQGLRPRELAILDAFEDQLYQRTNVSVIDSDGRRVQAEAYCVAERYRRQLTLHDWDVDRFIAHDMAGFIARIKPLRPAR